MDRGSAERAGKAVHMVVAEVAVLHLLPFAWDSFGSRAAAVDAADVGDVVEALAADFAAVHGVAADPLHRAKAAP